MRIVYIVLCDCILFFRLLFCLFPPLMFPFSPSLCGRLNRKPLFRLAGKDVFSTRNVWTRFCVVLRDACPGLALNVFPLID